MRGMRNESTSEERERVTRDMCRQEGHSFDIILAYQTLAPQTIICRRCGSGWAIVHRDKDFGDKG
jgi:hypothetical protein